MTLSAIIARKEAKAQGLNRYFTGKPCRKGHIDYRNLKDSGCFACAREKSARARKENPEIVKKATEQSKKRYANDPEYRAKVIERVARWADENKSDRTAYRKEYYAKNKEKASLYAKARYLINRQNPEWLEKERARQAGKHEANPEHKRSAVRTRRARIRDAEGRHNAKDVKAILERQLYKCIYCEASLVDRYDVDHIVPISRGGSNWPENLQCLCPTCNGRKWCKTHEEFLKEISA